MKRRVYVAMLVLAGGAFAADRWIFAGPSAARAAPHAAVALPTKAINPVPAVIPPADADAIPDLSVVTRHLKAAAEIPAADRPPRDAFTPSPAWLALSAAQAHKSSPAASVRFRQQHRLSAVMTGRRGLAIVDGKTLAVGQTVDGFRLTAVREHSAVFESAGEQVELRLPMQ